MHGTQIFVYLFSSISYTCRIFVLKQSYTSGKYRKILLLRCIHHFKSDLINNMGLCAFRVLNPHKAVCLHYICLNYLSEAECRNRAYRSGISRILSVVSVVASEIGRGWSYRAGICQPERQGLVGKRRI